MKVRIMFVDLAIYPDREAEALDLGDVRIIKVLDNWNTPRGQAVKMLVEELDSSAPQPWIDPPPTGGFGG